MTAEEDAIWLVWARVVRLVVGMAKERVKVLDRQRRQFKTEKQTRKAPNGNFRVNSGFIILSRAPRARPMLQGPLDVCRYANPDANHLRTFVNSFYRERSLA